MKTLERQLGEFGELHDEQWGSIKVDDILLTAQDPPMELAPPPRRPSGWAYAAAGVAFVALLAALSVWLSGTEQPVVTSPDTPVTTMPDATIETVVESSGEALELEIEWSEIEIGDQTWFAFDQGGIGAVSEELRIDVLLADGHPITYLEADGTYQLHQNCFSNRCFIWSSVDGLSWSFEGNQPPFEYFLDARTDRPMYMEYNPRFDTSRDDPQIEQLIQPLGIKFDDGLGWQELEYNLPIDVEAMPESPVWNVVAPSSHPATSDDSQFAFMASVGQMHSLDPPPLYESIPIDRWLVVFDGQEFVTMDPPAAADPRGNWALWDLFYLGWLGDELFWTDLATNEAWSLMGTEWVPVAMNGPLRNPEIVDFVGGRVFVVDGFRETWTSTDLTVWHRIHGPGWSGNWDLQSTDFGWMLTDQEDRTVWISDDGIHWSQLQPPSEEITHATYANGLFVVGLPEGTREAWIGRVANQPGG